MAMNHINNDVRLSSDRRSIDKIRLITVCLKSEVWPSNRGKGCGCFRALPWFHNACGGQDWIDKRGQVYCTPGCYQHGKKSLFECDFMCSTDRTRVAQFKANMANKLIAAMRDCCSNVMDDGALDRNQEDALDAWAASLSSNLRERSREC